MVKPIFFSLSGLLAVVLMGRAQSNVAQQPAVPQNETPPSVTPTNAPHRLDATDIVQNRLKQLQVDVPVSYRTNGNLIFCTVHCQNLDQRNTVYDDFTGLPKYGLSATKSPPAVTIVLLLDPGRYFSEQQNQKLNTRLKTAETNLVGHVLQKIPEGLLVALPDSKLVVVTEAPNLNEGDPIKTTAYRIGALELSDKNGAKQSVPKFTCDLATATDYYTPMAATEAKTETQKRAEITQ